RRVPKNKEKQLTLNINTTLFIRWLTLAGMVAHFHRNMHGINNQNRFKSGSLHNIATATRYFTMAARPEYPRCWPAYPRSWCGTPGSGEDPCLFTNAYG
ncbi:MAG: hypothetical protein ABIX01_14925, partial [Chitinophagaceae bacterium]